MKKLVLLSFSALLMFACGQQAKKKESKTVETKKEVVMQDVPGWQCKASYFGAYDEPAHKLVYHTASTDCWRITVSYIFNREEMSLGLQEDVIEEIKSK